MNKEQRIKRLEQISGKTGMMTWKESIDKVNSCGDFPEFDKWLKEQELKHDHKTENKQS